MLQWLRRYLSASQPELLRLTAIVADLSTQIDSLRSQLELLKRGELERDAAMADTVDKLQRYYKRLRQRQLNDDDDEEAAAPKLDPISRMVIARRAARAGHRQGGD